MGRIKANNIQGGEWKKKGGGGIRSTETMDVEMIVLMVKTLEKRGASYSVQNRNDEVGLHWNQDSLENG